MSGSRRIAQRFNALRAGNRAGLVTFVTAGDPDPETSAAILAGLPDAGADMIELGMPFSDPMADGPAIQASSQRALKAGANMGKTLSMVLEFRKNDEDTPVVLMGYFNPIHRYGVDQFLADAVAAGVDGLIIVDLPPEEDEMLAPLKQMPLDLIYLATPTTDENRLPAVIRNASGFLYYVSILGITGTRSAEEGDVEAAVSRLRAQTDLPIAVGFGIKTAEQVAAVGRIADAAVVGSALVTVIADHLNGNGQPSDDCADAALAFVRDLAAGLRR